LERRLPRHVETLSAEYSLARFGVVLRGRHYGQWTEPLNETTDDSGRLIYNQTFGNELFIDVLLSYDFTRALRLTVGVENIFDNYPDKARFPNTPEDAVAGKPPTTGRIYPSQRPYESDGGRVYARLNATF
jgi:iron complex outermembrane receptor protein